LINLVKGRSNLNREKAKLCLNKLNNLFEADDEILWKLIKHKEREKGGSVEKNLQKKKKSSLLDIFLNRNKNKHLVPKHNLNIPK